MFCGLLLPIICLLANVIATEEIKKEDPAPGGTAEECLIEFLHLQNPDSESSNKEQRQLQSSKTSTKGLTKGLVGTIKRLTTCLCPTCTENNMKAAGPVKGSSEAQTSGKLDDSQLSIIRNLISKHEGDVREKPLNQACETFAHRLKKVLDESIKRFIMCFWPPCKKKNKNAARPVKGSSKETPAGSNVKSANPDRGSSPLATSTASPMQVPITSPPPQGKSTDTPDDSSIEVHREELLHHQNPDSGSSNKEQRQLYQPTPAVQSHFLAICAVKEKLFEDEFQQTVFYWTLKPESDRQEVKCFVKCFLQEFGVVGENGYIGLAEKIFVKSKLYAIRLTYKAYITGEMYDTIDKKKFVTTGIEIVSNCLDGEYPSGLDPCEVAYLYALCLHNHDKSKYFVSSVNEIQAQGTRIEKARKEKEQKKKEEKMKKSEQMRKEKN